MVEIESIPRVYLQKGWVKRKKEKKHSSLASGNEVKLLLFKVPSNFEFKALDFVVLSRDHIRKPLDISST